MQKEPANRIVPNVTDRDSKPKIGIIGGLGRMGKWFEKLFISCGFDVAISDIGTAMTSIQIAEQCHVVIIAVPMNVFPDIVKEIAPHMKKDAFLTDICSLKERQVACMLEHTNCSVAGTHPLFGPGETSLQGRRIAICPGRGKRWIDWWETLLIQNGALCVRFSPDDHDRTMSWVQALNHFILMCLGKSLEEDGMNFGQIMHLATPSFERQMDILGRLCKQDPELYATIQMENPYTENALKTFMRHGDMLNSVIQSGDRKRFLEIFKEVQELGPEILKYCRSS